MKKIELTDEQLATLQWTFDQAEVGIERFWVGAQAYEAYDLYTPDDLRRFESQEKRSSLLRDAMLGAVSIPDEPAPLPEVSITFDGTTYSAQENEIDMPVAEDTDLMGLLEQLTADGPVTIKSVQYDDEEN